MAISRCASDIHTELYASKARRESSGVSRNACGPRETVSVPNRTVSLSVLDMQPVFLLALVLTTCHTRCHPASNKAPLGVSFFFCSHSFMGIAVTLCVLCTPLQPCLLCCHPRIAVSQTTTNAPLSFFRFLSSLSICTALVLSLLILRLFFSTQRNMDCSTRDRCQACPFWRAACLALWPSCV